MTSNNSSVNVSINRGLIIMEAPLRDILSGRKTWEMRSRNCNIRETIALVQKGTKSIYGIADLVASHGPLSDAELQRNQSKHRLGDYGISREQTDKYRHVWVLENVRALAKPIPFDQKSGAVIFTNLDDTARAKLARALA